MLRPMALALSGGLDWKERGRNADGLADCSFPCDQDGELLFADLACCKRLDVEVFVHRREAHVYAIQVQEQTTSDKGGSFVAIDKGMIADWVRMRMRRQKFLGQRGRWFFVGE